MAAHEATARAGTMTQTAISIRCRIGLASRFMQTHAKKDVSSPGLSELV